MRLNDHDPLSSDACRACSVQLAVPKAQKLQLPRDIHCLHPGSYILLFVLACPTGAISAGATTDDASDPAAGAALCSGHPARYVPLQPYGSVSNCSLYMYRSVAVVLCARQCCYIDMVSSTIRV